MSVKIVVPVREKVFRYMEVIAEKERKSRSDVVQALLEEGYRRKVEEFHEKYSRGEITLREMARRLGLSYRELYQMLADEGLPQLHVLVPEAPSSSLERPGLASGAAHPRSIVKASPREIHRLRHARSKVRVHHHRRHQESKWDKGSFLRSALARMKGRAMRLCLPETGFPRLLPIAHVPFGFVSCESANIGASVQERRLEQTSGWRFECNGRRRKGKLPRDQD